LREKFLMLTRHCTADDMGEMFDRLQDLEHEPNLDWIGVRSHDRNRAPQMPSLARP
jgi:hypothetical protein